MKLKKPGEGLPSLERLFIKNILIPITKTALTWNTTLYLFKREVKIISKLVQSIPKSALQQKTIIRRTFAIEDNSRQFSVNMVIEHLTIAGFGIMNVINTLSKEKEFTKDIKIEDVKPFENKEDSINDFLNFAAQYASFIQNLPKTKSIQKKAHPWFIEFNNFEWSIFIFMHTFIHRRQIQAIISQLKRENLI